VRKIEGAGKGDEKCAVLLRVLCCQ
jgi:hypothetical protein